MKYVPVDKLEVGVYSYYCRLESGEEFRRTLTILRVDIPNDTLTILVEGSTRYSTSIVHYGATWYLRYYQE